MTTTLLALNLAGAVVALAANTWAALTGPTSQRPIRAAIAIAAAVYVTLYVTTLAGAMSTATRTALAQGLGPAVWMLVWAAPAIRSTRAHHHNIDALRRLIDRVEVET